MATRSPGSSPRPFQSHRELPGALAEVGERVGVEAPVRHPRHDLLVGEVRLRALEDRGQRQLEVHHQAVHDVVLLRAEALPKGELLVARHVAVALHVAVLAADDQEHELVVADVRDPARGGRLDVKEASRAECPLLAVHLDPRRAAVDEVELVLGVVVVVDAGKAGGIDDAVDPECGDPHRAADLAEAGAVAQLVERRKRMSHQEDLPLSERRGMSV